MIIMAMTRNMNLLNIVMTLVNMSFLGGKGWEKLGFCLGGVQRSTFQNPLLDGSLQTKQHIFKPRHFQGFPCRHQKVHGTLSTGTP